MASVEWTFLLMNAFPGRAQTFVDNAISKIFPATSAEGFQTIASEESPNLPAALRIQWTSVGREEKMVLASRVMLLRFHVKLLVALILFMLLFVGLLFLAPFAFFAILSSLVLYLLVICSYTAFASWLIVTEKSLIVAVPSWKYRWLAHLNLLVPRFAGFCTDSSNRYSFYKYQSNLINRIETPTFHDGSCKILIDYKAGLHMMSDASVMDHFASASNVRSALAKLGRTMSDRDLEAGHMNDESFGSHSAASSSIPPHIAEEIHANEFSAPKSNKDRLD